MSAWITRRPPTEVDAEAAGSDRSLPLARWRLGVKDNIDVAGLPTTAGCPAFAYEPADSAPVVERLVAAGAVVAGKTNLDQFATGLVGTRTPYGALESPVAPGRVSGGSSSGSAVAVARGEVDVALGTDTAGSGRVPAALCGIVGLKPTRGWLSSRGVVPACRSLDCVSVFATDVVRAATAVEAAAGYDALDPWSRRAPARGGRPIRRLGIPSRALLDASCDLAVAAAFHALDLGAYELVEVDLSPYLEAGALLYEGAFVAERYAAVGAFIAAHPAEVDPVVGGIIASSADLPAHALAADHHRLAGLRRWADGLWAVLDAVVLPTVPTHPTLADVAADPLGPNTALGRFTNGTNLLDWCAAAVPAGTRADGLPFGISVLGPAWSDHAVWAAAAQLAGLRAPPSDACTGEIPLVVCGAHLEGEPLHHQLTDRGARLLARTATAPRYRMHALATTPPKPGMVRVPPGQGASLEVEVWGLDAAAFGTFVAAVPAPLTIGSVELADGTWAKGFLCEGHALAGTTDITQRGGWRAWLAR